MFSPYNCVGVTGRRAYMLNPNAFYAKLRYRQKSYEVCTFGEKKTLLYKTRVVAL